MTQDEVFDLAAKVGLGFIRHASARERNKFELFTKLVAEHEREACAKLCEEPGWNAANWCAKAIRARGQA